MCDHGLIVKDLHDVLSRRGFKIGNDFEHDLLIANAKGEITTVFQVITDASVNSIQSGAAQLLLASTDLPGRPCLVLIVPDNVNETLESKLKKLGIDLLVYGWRHDQAIFPELANIAPIR